MKTYADYYLQTLEQLEKKIRELILKYNLKFGYGLLAGIIMIKNKIKK